MNFFKGFLVVGSLLFLNVAFAKTIVIDVRTPEEYNLAHIDGALNIDFRNPSFVSEIGKLDRAETYKLYCRSGNRSGQAMAIMKNMNFKDVENLGSLEQAREKLKAQ